MKTIRERYRELGDVIHNGRATAKALGVLVRPVNDLDFIEVWYAKRPDFRNHMIFAQYETHVMLGTIRSTHVWYDEARQIDEMERVYFALQGEHWSPNGEARWLIEEKGLVRTSMSIGDVLRIIRDGDVWQTWVVDSVGFKRID